MLGPLEQPRRAKTLVMAQQAQLTNKEGPLSFALYSSGPHLPQFQQSPGAIPPSFQRCSGCESEKDRQSELLKLGLVAKSWPLHVSGWFSFRRRHLSFVFI
jgi:hypothetical protein